MRDSARTQDVIEVGQACLAWLANDVNELERFMGMAGYTPERLRAELGTLTLSSGLIDYFGRNEPLLLAMCANTGLSAERVMRAWHALNPQG